ncbi:hypothetical protein BDM02DRAFT_3122847 [Thelephora ganbajun]|uniref:Uncharacterized protein n=1 Tax=Thelephora ganbajun TaxID=370292 RepID=A0ACB6Z3G6_THEGA|nr:hypothetical protein BDM02DRAFT_3122847 [Thelephora ganbajun]
MPDSKIPDLPWLGDFSFCASGFTSIKNKTSFANPIFFYLTVAPQCTTQTNACI